VHLRRRARLIIQVLDALDKILAQWSPLPLAPVTAGSGLLLPRNGGGGDQLLPASIRRRLQSEVQTDVARALAAEQRALEARSQLRPATLACGPTQWVAHLLGRVPTGERVAHLNIIRRMKLPPDALPPSLSSYSASASASSPPPPSRS